MELTDIKRLATIRYVSKEIRSIARISNWRWFGLLVTVGLTLIVAHFARGGVVVDGSLVPSAAGPRFGPNYAIPARLGLQLGSNLFESFSQFDIASGESATFSGPSGITDVIARVTGGSSTIDGLLANDIPNANLILINQSGVSFGPHASLALSGGSFVVSTASYLKLADGTRFAATLGSSDSTLTTAAPAAFGFLKSSPAPVVFAGDVSQNPAGFAVPDGRSLSVVAGNIQITGGKLIAANQGAINLIAVRAAGEVQLDPSNPAQVPAVAKNVAGGSINLAGGVSVSAPEGGRINILGGSLDVNKSSVSEDNTLASGGGIDVAVAGPLSIAGGHIGANTDGAGSGGSVALSADSVTAAGLFAGGGATTSTAPITADTHGPGAGGQITINTGALSLSQNAFISALTGPAVIISPNLLHAAPRVQSSAAAPAFFGNGGSVTINASRGITFDGSGSTNTVGILAETTSLALGGHGGNISINAGELNIRNTAEITSTTKGSGNAGNIAINAQRMIVDGGGEASTLTGVQARVGEGEQDLGATGAGGQVTIEAESLVVRDGGVITTTTFGQGNAGSMMVRADNILMHAPLRPNPRSAPSDVTGTTLFTGLFARAQPGAAQGAAAGGAGGNITVVASGDIHLRGDARFSAIGENGSSAGRVSVRAGNLVLGPGSSATVAAGNAQGGNVNLRAAQSIRLTQAFISATAGSGGNVFLAGRQSLAITNSLVTAQAFSLNAHGGRISLDPEVVALSGSKINGLSAGAPVPVTVPDSALFLRSETPILSAAISVPPEADVSGSLVLLQTGLANSATLVPRCGLLFGVNQSSFVVTGRGGIPSEPGGWLPELDLTPAPGTSQRAPAGQ
jgi:filamentous hemagglutinin family protein